MICRIHCKKIIERVYYKYKNFEEKPFIRYGTITIELNPKEWAEWINLNLLIHQLYGSVIIK